MRKTSQPNAIQLSLFDFPEEENNAEKETRLDKEFKNAVTSIIQNKNTNDETDNGKNDGLQRQEILSSGERGNHLQEQPRMEGENTLRPDAGHPTGEIRADESNENAQTLSTPDGRNLQQADGGLFRTRSLHTGSGGNKLEAGDGVSRGIIPILNFHFDHNPSSAKSFNKKSRLQDNLNALTVLYTLEQEKRLPNEEEKLTLAKYVGWGGLKQILLDPSKDNEWTVAGDIELRETIKKINEAISLLDPDTSKGLLQSAQRSILNAHYTSYNVINAIYHALDKAGFSYGKILEPSAGIGNFLAAMPIAMANNSEVTAIEKDTLSGMILQKLYPTALAINNGYEKVNIPEESQDLIISNIPFGDIKIYDKALITREDKTYAEAASNLHNYFFAKSVLLAKPGGLITFITSRYTLDSENDAVRKLINNNCQFIGAVRLPGNTFEANAGTSVVSDLIFLKKFDIGEERKNELHFLKVKTVPFKDKKGVSGDISYNQYYHNHPEHLLGDIEFGGLYRKDEFFLTSSKEDTENIKTNIEAIAKNLFPKPVYKQTQNHYPKENLQAATEHFIKLKEYDTIGNLVVLENGIAGVITDRYHIDEKLDAKAKQLGIAPHTLRQPLSLIASDIKDTLKDAGIDPADFHYRIVEKLRSFKNRTKSIALIQDIREKTKELIYKETSGYSEYAIESLRHELKNSYLKFTRQNGNLLNKENEKLLKLDTDQFLIRSLERKDNLTGKIIQADILSKRTLFPEPEVHHSEDIREAAAISLQKFGRLNMNFLAEIMDKPISEILSENDKSEQPYIFLNEKGEYLSREEYLSGNVVDKLRQAKGLVNENPHFEINIRELEKAQPHPIEATDIYLPLHARWIPHDIINDFLKAHLKTESYDLKYSPSTDTFNFSLYDTNGVLDGYATKRKNGSWVLSHALNGIEPRVTYTEEDEHHDKKIIFDPEDTQLAKNNYRKIRSEWDNWKYADYARRIQLETIYNNRFNNTILRNYDGSKLTLPGLIGYTLRPHQKDCVFRNIQQFGGINDHRVGAGKTLIQIATAMELRRLGLANKPLIIGLKSQIPQLYEQFKKAYPLAKVLYPSEKDFQKSNRKHLLSSIATNDWDCIILSHDQFNLIQQPIDIQLSLIDELKSTIQHELDEATDKQHKKQLIKRLENYKDKIDRLLDTKKDKDILDFSKLGVDFLMVDESQEFKNLEFITSKHNIKGLGNPMGSKKAFNLLIAARYLQELHEGDKGVLFASGTPISNTMAELYLLMKYLRPGKISEQGLDTFDKWAGLFANDYSDLEYYMGRFKEVHRFREFVNLPELITTYREIADVRNDQNLIIEKPKAIHELIKIQPTTEQTQLIEKLQEFIDTKGNKYAGELGLTAGYDAKKRVNPSYALLAINFAKRLSLDPRLLSPKYAEGSKLGRAAENIARIYQDTGSFKGTQLVFSDMGTPKGKNSVDNLYEHLNGDIPQSDLNDIFGKDYYEKASKPSLKDISAKVSETLKLSPEETDKLIEEANLTENFNAYSELKHLLVGKGIPAGEIAFIHDYNTRLQRSGLYDKVNKGDIRILLGSTKKLGTGVNVQTRVVAGHHLDISWRPSDIEQRNGRFERQGNEAAKTYLHNQVHAYYYATERTLDASMYNTVSQKVVFINQIKASANPSVRTVKDIEEDIDISTMAAELSGDPIFKERATLTKNITELEMMEKAFNSKKFSTENKIINTDILLEKMTTNMKILERNIPFLEQIPKNEKGEYVFTATLNGRKFDKVGEYGTAVIAEIEHAKKYYRGGDTIPLGNIWGFTVNGIVKKDFITEEKRIFSKITSPLKDVISHDKTLSNTEVSAGVQLKSAILIMPRDLKLYQEEIKKETDNLAEYKKQIREIFPHREELMNKQKRLLEVNEIIKEKTKEKKPENSPEIEGLSNSPEKAVSEKEAEYRPLRPKKQRKFSKIRL